ncbi:hypothetical protein ESCO_003301 [Escovopsis weberi]|uniref:Alpha-1,3/1,6-mannosyltransferase ALG2 n=1 Tax=Escovopsis weberi TaxID=150374 RepID=A0A0M8MSQ3_ESCWE|nr:hypothetical protein ESCO_003301 [Escovopsis weberi]
MRHVSPAARGPVVFFHPDLGIGGAERLVVDAAVGLQSLGHEVVIYTSHCDPAHCFEECRDGTLDVRVHGDWLPMSVLNRLTIVCAIARHLYLLLRVHLSGELARLRPRAFCVDQLSAGLPLLRLLAPDTPILFYCHFPDLLLVQGRASPLKRLYRVPFDRLEQWSMTFAHAVAVNSDFTRGVVRATWPRLGDAVDTKVVYPCVDTSDDKSDTENADKPDDDDDDDAAALRALFGDDRLLLSINRFERKKDIGLAIRAFAAIPEPQRRAVRLVLAGGYDPRVAENVHYHRDLQDLAASLALAHTTLTPSDLAETKSSPHSPHSPSSSSPAVIFLLSVPGPLKAALLRRAAMLLYTPPNEHFGIVPLEAMLARTPVLACASGGPVETIRDGATGWLRDPDDVASWTRVVSGALAMAPGDLARMGDDGAQRVRDLFGRDKMALRLDGIVEDLAREARASPGPRLPVGALLALAVAVLMYCTVPLLR